MAEEARRRAEIARYVTLCWKNYTIYTLNRALFAHAYVKTPELIQEIFLVQFNRYISDLQLKQIPVFLCYVIRELHTLKGRVESFAKLKGLDIDVNPHYTVWGRILSTALRISLLTSFCFYISFYFSFFWVVFTHQTIWSGSYQPLNNQNQTDVP